MTEWHHSDSSRAHLGGIETTKKICTDGVARFFKNLGFGNRTKPKIASFACDKQPHCSHEML